MVGDIDAIRQDYEKAIAQVRIAVYDFYTGKTKEFPNIDQLWTKNPVFDDKIISFVKNQYESEQDPEQHRRLQSMLSSLEYAKLPMYLDSIERKLNEKKSKLSIELDGRKVPFSKASVDLKNEPDRLKRKKMYEGLVQIVEKDLQNDLSNLYTARNSFAKEMGYSNFAEFVCGLNGMDVNTCLGVIDDILEKTENTAQALLKNKLDKSGILFDDLKMYDVPRVLYGSDFDIFFPREGIESRFKQALSDTGFDTDGITMVLNNKLPIGGTFPIDIPNDIRIILSQDYKGEQAYRVLAHELGHGIAYKHFDVAEFEYKYLGDEAVSEGYAFTFENLLTNKEFLLKVTGIDNKEAIEEIASDSIFRKVYGLRHIAATAKYFIESYLDPTNDEKRCQRIFAEALMVDEDSISPKHYSLNPNDFISINHLNGLIFESNLTSVLMERYGENWFLNKDACIFLKKVMSNGRKYNIIEMTKQIGIEKHLLNKNF